MMGARSDSTLKVEAQMSHRIFICDRKRHLFDGRVECSDIRIASSNAVSFLGDGGKDWSARSGRTIFPVLSEGTLKSLNNSTALQSEKVLGYNFSCEC
jgi:hypothetical protein